MEPAGKGNPKTEELASRLWLDEAARAFGNVPASLKLAWEADRKSAIAMGLVSVILAIVPVLQAWAGKLIVDSVVHSLQARLQPGDGLRQALPFLALEFVLMLVGTGARQWRRFSEQILDQKLAQTITTRIIEKALSLDLTFFENDEFYDRMQNAKRQAQFRPLAIVNGSFDLLKNALLILSVAGLLIAFSPLATGVLFLAVIPAFLVQNHYSRLNFRLQSYKIPETRQMYYLEQLLTSDWGVKEVKLYSLGRSLVERHKGIFDGLFKEDLLLTRKRSWKSLHWGLLSNLGFYAAYAWVILQTVRRTITLGGMTLYLSLFQRGQESFQGLLDNVSSLYENGLFMENLFGFLAIEPARKPATRSPPPGEFKGLELRGVSFRYPGSADCAVHGVDLKVAKGQMLALVGENGSGKTTLVKLISNLYRPTEGEILFDGVALENWNPDEFSGKVGVIFQDFVRYHALARENIGFGAMDRVADLGRIQEAAARSGASEVFRHLPRGTETMLGKFFNEGYDLSGGQWQKVALGRAFMRDSEILILDEPTAALDAFGEQRVFEAVRDLAAGRVVILVSHRFSTVRMADQILVMKSGRIEELGSHEELVGMRGTYAKLFETQAEAYK